MCFNHTGTTEEEAELYSSNGPLWYRGWALEDEDKVCADVEKVLAKTGTRRMIMGHTPDFHVSYISKRPSHITTLIKFARLVEYRCEM